jgi:REP element-mobilizing transposase RayT
MTNHVHSTLSAREENLSDLIRDFKRFTATKIIKTIEAIAESRKDWMLKRFEFAARSNIRNGKHQFWTHENHAEVIYSHDFLVQKMTYIHENPVRAGWVEKPEDWMYSSLRNYLGLPALIEINVMDF